jgi:hypothetical protein
MGDFIGAPASGSDGLTGTSLGSTRFMRDLGRLDGEHRVRALASGGHEQVVQVLHGRLRVERHHGVLELLVPTTSTRLREHSTSESPTEKSPRHTSYAERCRPQGGPHGFVLRHQQPRGTDQVAIRVPGGRHVELVAAHYGNCDADRAGIETATFADWRNRLLAARDRLLQDDRDAGRFVP